MRQRGKLCAPLLPNLLLLLFCLSYHRFLLSMFIHSSRLFHAYSTLANFLLPTLSAARASRRLLPACCLPEAGLAANAKAHTTTYTNIIHLLYPCRLCTVYALTQLLQTQKLHTKPVSDSFSAHRLLIRADFAPYSSLTIMLCNFVQYFFHCHHFADCVVHVCGY